MAKKQFKAESKRLLDLMINSIYTHKEIFLRELISNGSDAIDKLYYRSLVDDNTGVGRDDFSIRVEADKESRTLRIIDNGMGMTKEEMEQNLGTIAKSGSLAFKTEKKEGLEKNASAEDGNQDAGKNTAAEADIDIIGQFGVGFYSAFMVSDKVTVISKAFGESQAYKWESTGVDGYTLKESDINPGDDLAELDASIEGENANGDNGGSNSAANHGTEIILHLKEDTPEENYGAYLDEYSIRGLIKKYSDYIRYPITMVVEKQRVKEAPKEDDKGETDDKSAENKAPEYESYKGKDVLNSMIPIWKKQKNQLTDEDYNEFYKGKFMDFTDPAKVIHTSVEGVTTYDALLFIPGQAPFDYYSKEYEKGLQLYSSGVMIMEKCPDLLPDYYSFVRGIVDSQDLSLNISREMLQHDRQLKAIGSRLEKKIKSELLNMQKNDREKYEEFFKIFGLQIKFGLYDKMGMYKENLKELVMYYSDTEKKPVTIAEYIERMKEDQKYIYYATGPSIEKIDKLPQIEMLKDKGFEILYLTDDIDEFAIQSLREYDSKEFKSVSAEDLDVGESNEEKEASKKQEEDNKELLDFMKETLGDKVTDVRISHRLKSHPVCLTTRGPVSLEMEKVLSAMPANEGIKAERILEINSSHDILKALNQAFSSDKEKVKEYTNILFNQALLIEGMPIEDPVAYGNAVCNLMK